MSTQPKVQSSKPKAKKVANRDIVELAEMDPKKMTDSEKNQYIEELRGYNTLLRNQYANLDETAKRSFEKTRSLEKDLAELSHSVERDMNLICSAATLMAESIISHTFHK